MRSWPVRPGRALNRVHELLGGVVRRRFQCHCVWSVCTRVRTGRAMWVLFFVFLFATWSLAASSWLIAAGKNDDDDDGPATSALLHRFVTETSGLSECRACPPGSKAADAFGASVCSQCTAGFFANSSGLTTCYACERGFFQPAVNGSVCAACAAGQVAANVGASECSQCGQGTFSAADGLSACSFCSEGEYQGE